MGRDRVDAVERALSLLEAFRVGRQEMSLAELAEETGLYKSTILRQAASLIRFGYMVRNANGTYRLGPSLWRLGSLYRRGFALGEAVRPILRGLVEATGETASFYVPEQGERLCLYREHPAREDRHHLEEGARLPLDRGAAGRVLCGAPGVVTTVGERNPHLAAVACAIRADGTLRGALTVSGPVERFGVEARARAERLIAHAAGDLQTALAQGQAGM